MKGLKRMIDIEKFDIVINDKRVTPRSKLIFLLLKAGYSLLGIRSFSALNLDELKSLPNGEVIFMQYARGAGVVERMSESGLLFPGTEGKPLKEITVLSSLRRACRINGFQLYELGIDGLVNTPNGVIKPDGFKSKSENMSFDDIKNFIQGK